MKKYKLSELLERDEVVIHTPKKEQDEKLRQVLDEKGCIWADEDRLTSWSELKYHKDRTCFFIYKDKKKVYYIYLYLQRYLQPIYCGDIDLEK